MLTRKDYAAVILALAGRPLNSNEDLSYITEVISDKAEESQAKTPWASMYSVLLTTPDRFIKTADKGMFDLNIGEDTDRKSFVLEKIGEEKYNAICESLKKHHFLSDDGQLVWEPQKNYQYSGTEALTQPDSSDIKLFGDKGKTESPIENLMIAELKELLLSSGQIILTGAPGTGKTYLAKQIAYALTGDNAESSPHIDFCQFHPSFDYTDFVEGLRPMPPKDESGTIGFERRDGIFKSFCKKALKNFLDSEKSAKEIESEENALERINSFLNDAIENQKIFKTVNQNSFYIVRFDDDNIYINVPGNEVKKDVAVPYSELQKVIADNLTLNKPGDVKKIFNRVYNYQYDSYLYVIYQEIIKLKTGNFVSSGRKVDLQNFVFIIDEINRGDISKIFGELFYAIDPGYRGVDGKVKTQYHNLIKDTTDLYKDGFYIPENVYIIGTMNDIDRSVESMDFAIRRRFTWKEIKAEDRISMWDGQIDHWKDEAGKRMKALNEEISKTDSLSDAFHVGPAYFLKLADVKCNFQQLWDLHIMPLLKEYLRGTVDPANDLARFKNAYDLKNLTAAEAEATVSEE